MERAAEKLPNKMHDDDDEHLRILFFAMTTPYQLNRTLIKYTDKYENKAHTQTHKHTRKKNLVRNNKL